MAADESPQLELLLEAIRDLSRDATAYVNCRFPSVMERLLGEQPKEIDFKSWDKRQGPKLWRVCPASWQRKAQR